MTRPTAGMDPRLELYLHDTFVGDAALAPLPDDLAAGAIVRARAQRRRTAAISATLAAGTVVLVAVGATLAPSLDPFALTPATPATGGGTSRSNSDERPEDAFGNNDAELADGRHKTTVDGVRISYLVQSGGWEDFSLKGLDASDGIVSLNKSWTGPQGAEGIIYWTAVTGGAHADPCPTSLAPRDVLSSLSAGDLASLVATAPGTELVTGPSHATVGGLAAKRVVVDVREDLGCDPGFFYRWRDNPWGALWTTTEVGTRITVWIVDVDEVRLFIAAELAGELPSYARSDLNHEMQAIVDSIRFG